MRYTVITSIYPPGEAVEGFASLAGNHVVVAGDRKTPEDWSHGNTAYLSPDKQLSLSFRTVGLLPWNHYCRKMAGYLYAIQEGASEILDTDDDNIPYPGYTFPDVSFSGLSTQDGLGFVNAYQHFTGSSIWPRGLPLEKIRAPRGAFDLANLRAGASKIGVWQGLADLDPDVDAIYRLTSNKEVTFDKGSPVVLGKGTWCPFNSQNTLFTCRQIFPLLYLPAFVTFRFTDILRGYVAQPILQAAGYRLGFTEATVYQERNAHDLMRDFADEVPFYLNAQLCMDIACGAVSPENSVSQNLHAAYVALRREGIVPDEELPLLEAWLEDCRRLGI
jgi:hypothetical protein